MNDLTKYVPEGIAWARAAVAAIPMVGGALDHLLFDKADAIRIKNIQAALESMSQQLQTTNQEKIDKGWFETEEALAAFKILTDKVSYEPDPEKVDAIGRIVGACGTTEHSDDKRKLSIIEHLSRLSTTQIKLLSVVSKTQMQEKTIPSNSIIQTATAIWLSDIVKNLESGHAFWEGNLMLVEELEVLESLNTIRRVQLSGGELGFVVTTLGKLAASYVQTAKL